MTRLLMRVGAVDTLTAEQRTAAATGARNIYVEAGPGTGKTTVSAQRYGVQRFASAYRNDPRAVVAVSFTRSATRTLRRRVQRLWGPEALSWPNRIVTLDTIMEELLHGLIHRGLLVWPRQRVLWPDGDVRLNVHDSWASFSGTVRTRTLYRISVARGRVEFQLSHVPDWHYTYPSDVVLQLLNQGVCTHQDVRDILEQALHDQECQQFIQERLGETMRAFIVDEVFDANDLDIAVIEAAIGAGVGVTLVGDPWQALYVFRGARPEVVPELLARTGVRPRRLTQSFRWRARAQMQLATDVRAGHSVTLPAVAGDVALADLDVVLSLTWKPLWELGPAVLPLAFGAFKGTYEEAAATLLLNHITRRVFAQDATYLDAAVTALAVTDREVPRRLEPEFQGITDTLQTVGKGVAKRAYEQLVEVVATVSQRALRPPHPAYTTRLEAVQQRLLRPQRPVLGLTTHQAKGGEWNRVGLRLSDNERAALGRGLSVHEDLHRKLYVACTRAHYLTVEVSRPASPLPKRTA